MAQLLRLEESPGFSRSRGETILARLIREAGLPPPRRNSVVHRRELDFYWPDARLNAEVDGSTTHTRNRNFESDRERDAELATHGIQVISFTWLQLIQSSSTVVARLAAALAIRSLA